MALITCPECCRKNVSDMAISCPGCGFNLYVYSALLKSGQLPEEEAKQITNPEEYEKLEKELEDNKNRLNELKRNYYRSIQNDSNWRSLTVIVSVVIAFAVYMLFGKAFGRTGYLIILIPVITGLLFLLLDLRSENAVRKKNEELLQIYTKERDDILKEIEEITGKMNDLQETK